ncbi:DUF5639 domain-containing protein [Deinococcus deserti]|uniref:Putative Glycolate oxidase subunit GlcE n=1 Tax=Deinococcus deserti (strain DSM 17065 / CIP 109153 / LMG 22923 / VCD115) TaxID=546414 RepID=C1CVY3_DEIDV|nr:DUF5639 domain-containing protein [Deinococcus deserti]ACO46350.1 putative Glycolate oxidase subunit GlcE [Deinococcus deserti VCD115]
MPVLELSPGDQTVTVSGDTPLLEVYAALPAGLYPPFPPVELPGGVGGLVARGGFAQTFFFGAEVLGVTFQAPSGRTVHAGGRTVKNVQGYDLTRPFVGSFGLLGDALEVTLRLRPGRVGRQVVASATPEAGLQSGARFAWTLDGQLHLMHFGHAREVERALASLPEVREMPATLDLTSRFPRGMGVGEGPVRDRRFSWSDGAARPPVPPLFERLASTL